MPPLSLVASVVLFLTFFYVSLLAHPFFSNVNGIPDTSRYKQLRVMSKEEFPIDDPSRRVIIVGDVHGQFDYLKTLLQRLSYNSATDTLIHVGDIITKGPRSLDLLSYFSSNGVSGVRGNQDQKVIEWRGWLNWIMSVDGGGQFLQSAHVSWREAERKGAKLKKWNEHQRELAAKKWAKDDDSAMDEVTATWWRRVPEDWVLFDDAYTLASDIPEKDYEYLLSLPLKIYVPHVHLFLVHAGMLPHDPTYDYDDTNQPLVQSHMSRVYAAAAHVTYRPDVFRDTMNPFTGWLARLALFNRGNQDMRVRNAMDDARRGQQERAILGLALNRDPWVVTNIRGLKGNGKPTRSNKKGTPWAEIWNEDMSKCGGFGDFSNIKHHTLPCLPMTVVYGHAASRGLDVKRWTFGLDTGCVYGGRLSALVLGNTNNDLNNGTQWRDDGDSHAKGLVPFGDAGHARIVSVNCKP